MALNQVYIDQFPEITKQYLTDQIIAFKKTNNVYEPFIFTISDLSSFFIDKDYISTLHDKINNISAALLEVSSFLEKTLPKNTDLANYSTIENFTMVSGKLEQTNNFYSRLSGKATKDYLNAQYSKLIAELQHLKAKLGNSCGTIRWGSPGNFGYPYKTALVGLAIQVASGNRKPVEK